MLAVFDSLYTQQKSDILKLTLLEGEKDVFSESYSTIINNIKIKWGKKLASAELERANNNQKRIDSLFALSTKIENSIAKITLDKNFPYQQIWLKVAGYLYTGIYVNSDLTVTIDVDKLPKKGAYLISDGIVYSGTDGELNMVMNKYILYKKKEREDVLWKAASYQTVTNGKQLLAR